jgi:hypothetical protein
MKIMVFILYCGWALMVPQTNGRWSHLYSFDTADECHKQLSYSKRYAETSEYKRALEQGKCLPIDMVYGKERGTWQ